MIDRDKFFAAVRSAPFGGTMKQTQVDGCNTILAHWDFTHTEDTRWLAYMLATTFWETGRTMQPIEEWGHGAGHPYGEPDPVTGKTYYGRGYVQLTWKANYQKMQDLLGVPFVTQPELALNPEYATAILFQGMEGGLFTGVGLGKYFDNDSDDAVNARRIINGTDHARDIAAVHAQFILAIHDAPQVSA